MKTIIEMAHDAGFDITYDPTETPARCFVEAWEDQLEVFAALVAAAEREACLNWCAVCATDDGTAQKIDAAIRAMGRA